MDPAALIHDFVHVTQGPRIPAGEVYMALEVPKGEMLSDVVAIFASMDVVMGDSDR